MVRWASWVLKRVMAFQVPKNEEILDETSTEAEKESVLPSAGKERIRGAKMFKKERKGRSFSVKC